MGGYQGAVYDQYGARPVRVPQRRQREVRRQLVVIRSAADLEIPNSRASWCIVRLVRP